MRGPKPILIHLTDPQRAELERIVRRATSPQALVRRARSILAAAAGHNNGQIARQLDLHPETVRCWRGRWLAASARLQAAEADDDAATLPALIHAVLADAPRGGAPPKFSPEQICQLIALACEPPAASDRPVTHWTPPELADEAVKRAIVPTISPRSVGRFLKSSGSQTPSLALLAQPGPRR
jgi:putative transposase